MNDKYNFFEILNLIGFEKNNPDYITENFKQLSIVNHPDKFEYNKEEVEKRFYNICLSYLVLNDQKTRNMYLNYLSENNNNFNEGEFEDIIKKYSVESEKLTKLRFKEFIYTLKNQYKIITDLTVQTALGLYYDYIEMKNENVDTELYIDPEEIKPKVSLLVEIFFSYFKIIGILLIVYIIFFLISYLRM
jgi:hypothetical protein